MVQTLGRPRRRPDAVLLGEPMRKHPDYVSRVDADAVGQFLGGEIRVVQVVLAPVEELPDLFVR